MTNEHLENRVPEPWEYFASSVGRRFDETRRLRHVHTLEVARCLSDAGVELIEWLTVTQGWPWSDARILAGRFIDRSADWATTDDAGEALEANLRSAWQYAANPNQ